MQISDAKRDDEFRDVFDAEDLRKLFQSREYLEDTHGMPYRFWMPVLGLFTGCRLEELAQLHLADLREEDGVLVIDINNEGEKSVKTKAALRKVLIHPFLLEDLPFVAYVDDLKKKGETRLFPELKKRRDGYGQTVSKWFARYKQRCGIVEDGKKKDFHSFRHTFVNALKQNREVEPVMISELVGHLVDSMTMGRYGKRYNLKALLEAIGTLNYPVDLAHLKASRFVGGA
jgi:integrase